MLKQELLGRTSLAEQGTLTGTQEKKGVYDFWNKGQVTQEEYNDGIRPCRKKIRKVEVKLELKLATAVKYNKCFYKYANNKRRAKQNLHLYLKQRGA